MISTKRKFQSSKVREKRKRERLIKVSIISVILIVLFGGLAYLSRLNSVVIGEVEVKGNSITSNKEIENIVERELAGSYFFLLPRNNSIIYPRNDIKESLLGEIERINSVELNLQGLETLVVEIKEREPNATWCRREDCYFMDILGVVYSKAPEFSGDVFLKYHGDISGNPIGKRYLEEEYFLELNQFINKVKDLDLEVISISIDEFQDLEVGLKKGGVIIFNKEQDLNNLFSDLDSIFSDESFSLEFNGGATLDYIDLRFGNKVYFQFR